MSSAYPEQIAGEWIRPIQNGYKMACCDCSFILLIDFRLYNGNIQIRLSNSPRKTAALRRYDTKRFDRLFVGYSLAKKYNHIEYNTWTTIAKNNFILACSDCGLAHRINFRINKDNNIELQVFYATRETAGIRRGLAKDKSV